MTSPCSDQCIFGSQHNPINPCMFFFISGWRPKASNGSHIVLSLHGCDQCTWGGDHEYDTDWCAQFLNPITVNDKDGIYVRISSPPDCLIGAWRVAVESYQKHTIEGIPSPLVKIYKVELPLYMLFNPWYPGIYTVLV